jgi:hypothetical protein
VTPDRLLLWLSELGSEPVEASVMVGVPVASRKLFEAWGEPGAA